jgi:hypothetical protein
MCLAPLSEGARLGRLERSHRPRPTDQLGVVFEELDRLVPEPPVERVGEGEGGSALAFQAVPRFLEWIHLESSLDVTKPGKRQPG